MSDTGDIRRHADGSIDTGHYIARGRLARGRAALRAARVLRAWLGRLVSDGVRTVAAIRLRRILPGR